MVSFTRILSLSAFASQAFSLSLTPRWIDAAIDVFNGEKTLQKQLINVFPGVPNGDEKPVPGDSPVVQCEAHSPQILNLYQLTVDPNPPVRGANLTFTAEGYLSQTIEEGAYVEVDVRYGYIKLLHQTFDLCSEVTKVGMECPIKKGPQSISKEVEIPAEVPPGKYFVNAKAYTKDDEFITCLNAVVEFPPV